MVFRYEYRGGVWVDIEQPREEDIQNVVKEFSLGKQFEKEILSPTPTPLVMADGDATLLVLHFPAHEAKNGDTGNQEIDFIVGDHFIITAHYEVIASIFHLKKLLETQKLIGGEGSITTDMLIEIIFAHLYTSVRNHTDTIVDNLARVERDMFDGHERTTIRSISNINREFLHAEATLANQEEPLNHFLKELSERNSFGIALNERAARILAERTQVAQLITTHRAIAAELRETNTALLGARQNEIMKTLTTITVIVLPLELIAFIFGMHLPGTPLEGNPNAFLIIMLFMLGAVGCMVLFFAKKRWIF